MSLGSLCSRELSGIKRASASVRINCRLCAKVVNKKVQQCGEPRTCSSGKFRIMARSRYSSCCINTGQQKSQMASSRCGRRDDFVGSDVPEYSHCLLGCVFVFGPIQAGLVRPSGQTFVSLVDSHRLGVARWEICFARGRLLGQSGHQWTWTLIFVLDHIRPCKTHSGCVDCSHFFLLDCAGWQLNWSTLQLWQGAPESKSHRTFLPRHRSQAIRDRRL